MKALRLDSTTSPMYLADVAEPQLRSGGVIVKITHAPVASYIQEVVSGARNFMLPVPFTVGVGGIGVVEVVADDVPGLHPDQLVFIDPRMAWHTNGADDGAILIGWTGTTPLSKGVQELWRDGTFAERAVLPGECLTPIKVSPGTDLAQLTFLTYAAVPYGGLLKGGFRPGQTLVLGGATGNFGASGVLVALAMGAGRVVAVGRNRRILDQLTRLDERRVVAVATTGNTDADAATIRERSGQSDMVLDFMSARSDDPSPVIACIRSLRPEGTAVLMGGLNTDVALPYRWLMRNGITIRGNWMCPRHAPADLIRMVLAGTLDLAPIVAHPFTLEQFADALHLAPTFGGLEYCVLLPQQGRKPDNNA